MRGNHADALRDHKPRRVARNNKCRNAFRSGSLSRSCEQDIIIRNAAIGNIGLGPIDPPPRRRADRTGRHVRDVGAAFQLGQREGRHLPSGRHIEEVGRLLCTGTEQADRAGTQPLHGEDEIGQPGVPGERFSDQSEAAHIEIFVDPAMFGRNRITQPPAPSQALKQVAAFGIDIAFVVLQAGKLAHAPVFQIARQPTMAVIEKGPIEKGAVRQFSSPRKPDCACRQRPRKRAGNPGSACRSPAPAPPFQWRRRAQPPIRY